MIRVPLARPDITERDIKAVVAVLRTTQLSLGPKIDEFEKRMADYVGTRYAVAVSSGTAGLHLAVRSVGLTEGDEVITSPFSFIASANCILYEKARPVFVDIDPATLNVDPRAIEKNITGRTKAILPVHVFGRPCDMTAMARIARKYGLKIIEDACEALGGEWKGQRVGTFGSCAVFAFYPNKQMTTGEGGVIVTDSRRIADLCRSLRNQGRGGNGRWLRHTRMGYNYRITDIQCALGISQLSRFESMLAKRNRVAGYYRKRLTNIKGITAPMPPGDGRMSWFVYVVLLDEVYGQKERDRLIRRLAARGIESSNYFPPIHLQPFYRKAFGFRKGDFPITESIAERTLALPFYNSLQEGEVGYVCEVLAEELLRL